MLDKKYAFGSALPFRFLVIDLFFYRESLLWLMLLEPNGSLYYTRTYVFRFYGWNVLQVMNMQPPSYFTPPDGTRCCLRQTLDISRARVGNLPPIWTRTRQQMTLRRVHTGLTSA